ncbi:MAG: histidine phosphatase family protein [Actinobacteria bacterium]|nr:histidine phosphatase family protein [Actinomycetota bacterium]
MPRLILVRHGEAAAGWNQDRDPGLSEEGHRQAAEMAAGLKPLGPLAIVVSPLRRTRETAAPLEAAWGVTATVDAGVGEIVSPIEDLEERTVWLRGFMAGAWGAATPEHATWRRTVVDTLLAIPHDAVVVTHFIAINAAVGAATADDRVVSFMPGNCSRTTLDVVDGRLSLVELGGAAISVVNT